MRISSKIYKISTHPLLMYTYIKFIEYKDSRNGESEPKVTEPWWRIFKVQK